MLVDDRAEPDRQRTSRVATAMDVLNSCLSQWPLGQLLTSDLGSPVLILIKQPLPFLGTFSQSGDGVSACICERERYQAGKESFGGGSFCFLFLNLKLCSGN